MSEVEKLRALLAEARRALSTEKTLNEDTERWEWTHGKLAKRIDAALAEPVDADHALTVREACRRRMPLDGVDAQALEGALALTERERDEARAEVERLKESNRLLRHDADKEWGTAATAIAAAFQRGAEAMREAAAKYAYDACGFYSMARDIRALLIPEDK